MWNIKKIVSKGDYNYAIVYGHPYATKNNYVLLHRIVVENHLGRILNKNEIVHHIDKNKKNNNISNLEVTNQADHARLHGLEQGRKMCELKCPQCGMIFVRYKNQTHLQKNSNYTCCSSSCRGKLSRYIQLNGITPQVESAISVNILREFNSLDNTEGTYLQETP